AEAWRIAIARRDGPTALLLTRQKLPVLPAPAPGAVAHGAYVRAEASDGAPEAVLVATGSEVSLALAARDRLEAAGVPTRVVSAPSLELLARQEPAYQRQVLGPAHVLRVAIEMGRGQGWHRWVGDGEIMSLNRFGASAPAAEVMRALGYSVDAVVERVRAALARRRWEPAAVAMPAVLEPRARELRDRLHASHASERLLAHDAGLWGADHAASAATRLGWLDLPARMRGELPALERLAAALAAAGATRLYWLGMGGSSLAPRVIREVGGDPSGRELTVVDTTDPDHVGQVLDSLDPATSAVVAVSKSGTTVETAALLELFWQRFAAAGPEPGSRFVALTEPGTPLARLAGERSFRAILPHPVDVGGRYAALSAVGVLPALWLGLDAEVMLAGAERALAGLGDGHPAVETALAIAAAATDGHGTLVWQASPRQAPLGAWVEQLVAESTGKDGRGVLPVLAPGPAAPGSAWPSAAHVSPREPSEELAGLDAALDAAAERGPVVRWPLRAASLGEAFMGWEIATALVGFLLGVNPFDEPDVVGAKERARKSLAGLGARALAPTPDAAAALASHLDGVGPGGAVALLAYLAEDAPVARALHALAAAISTRLGVPVTAAFGPRYLHSTGQLHKGGAPGLVPVVITGDPGRDLAVPGRSHTLGQLRLAQALGDVAALRDAGRRVLYLHIGGDQMPALEAMRRAFSR
ncbi:MAG TPA: transketolase C-terminal domain-containing protein, partial [Thermoanaerobaculaceae bacterium]|nr:transketolase C-terminal domain-containing protein [Thermoanaerobaculaceae bacterium]